jgi:hypothetical protein
VSLAIVMGTVLAFYLWTAATSVGPNLADRPATSSSLGSTSSPIDPSNKLVEAFLHGRLNVDVPLPRGLRPDGRRTGALYITGDQHDLSFHDGKLYTYWGPAPVLVLLLPAHVLGLGYLSQALAVLIFAAIAFLLSVALLGVLVRRLVPRTPHWAFLVGVVVVGTGNLAPYLLRRPEVYELASVSALCFGVAAVLCFTRALFRDEVRSFELALGSLCAGLALGSRPPLGVVGAIGVAVVLWRLFAGPRPSAARVLQLSAALMLPFLACAVAYGAYNQARFGSVFDFGDRHQLHAATRFGPPSSSEYVLPGLWWYALALPRLRLQFPYLWAPPGPWPGIGISHGYQQLDPTAGVLPTVPLLAALALVPWGWRRYVGHLRLMLVGLAVVGTVLLLFLAHSFGTATMRYELDFRTWLIVAALLAWLAAISQARSRGLRRALVSVGAVLATWGVIASVALSIVGEKDRFLQLHPAAYGSLARFFSPLPTAVAELRGHPLIAAVGATPNLAPWGYNRISLDGVGFSVGISPATLQVIAPHTGVFRLHARLSRVSSVPRSIRLRVGVSANRTGQFGPPTGAVAFPVLLKLGMNEVRVEVAYSASSLTDEQQGGLVQLSDVRIR